MSAAVTIKDLWKARPIGVASGQVLVLLTGSARIAGAGGIHVELHPLDAVCPRGQAFRLVVGSGRAAMVRIDCD